MVQDRVIQYCFWYIIKIGCGTLMFPVLLQGTVYMHEIHCIALVWYRVSQKNFWIQSTKSVRLTLKTATKTCLMGLKIFRNILHVLKNITNF